MDRAGHVGEPAATIPSHTSAPSSKWQFVEVAPFAQMVPQRRVCDPDRSHTCCRFVLHLNQWREFARVLPHITGRMHGGKQQTRYGDLVNDMKVGFCLFSFIALLAVCIPGVRLSVAIPISQIGHFQFVFGDMDRLSLSTQSCVCRWALSGVAVMMQVDQF